MMKNDLNMGRQCYQWIKNTPDVWLPWPRKLDLVCWQAGGIVQSTEKKLRKMHLRPKYLSLLYQQTARICIEQGFTKKLILSPNKLQQKQQNDRYKNEKDHVASRHNSAGSHSWSPPNSNSSTRQKYAKHRIYLIFYHSFCSILASTWNEKVMIIKKNS